jgi:sialate O-acetylesterase
VLKLFSLILFIPFIAEAQLHAAKFFSSNMVLQRDMPIHIWGKGVPGKKVIIQFAVKTIEDAIKSDSTWSIYFPAQKTNITPQSIIIISGKEKIELNNILIGDIWVCSGQSNMEWPMGKEMFLKDEIKQAHQPLIRLNNPPPAGRYVYGVEYTDSLNKRLNKEEFYLWGEWQSCDSNTVKPMSAVAYYFAKSIVAKENIPIGLINLSIGGAPIETFISREALQNSKQFSAKVKGNWLENDHLPEWIRERAKQNVGNNINGYGDEMGLNHAYKPGFAFQCGIEPLLLMPLKGIIWYQGESNSLEEARVNEYRDLLHLMIDDYRKQWKQSGMPFYWVQLSSIDTANYKSQYWPQFRDEQRKLLSEVRNGGMTVCSDIGFKDNVHPTNKRDVGERLARWALNKVYGQNIISSGPLPLTAKFVKDKVIISFQYAKGLATSDDRPARAFSINGQADIAAVIQLGTVIITTKEKPGYVYYGWKPFSDGNLVNSEKLPASTFKLKVQ